VDSYGEIAPNVPHALHMPSHIYVRLGDWPRTIEWNRRSAEFAEDHKVDGATSFHYIHALDYLVYGHLQRGEDKAAEAVWKTAQANAPQQGNFPGAYHLASIPARLAVENRNWEAAAALMPREPAGLLVVVLVLAEGLIHAVDGIELLPELTNSLNTRG